MCSIMAYCSDDYDLQKFKKGFERTISRGPDDCRIVDTGNGLLGVFAVCPSWDLRLQVCSPLSWTEAMLSATESFTDSKS